MRFHFNSSLFHFWAMPRPCSPLRSAAQPAHRSTLLSYAIAHRIFAWLILCIANLRLSIPQQFCTIPEHLRSIHFPGYVLPFYSLADPILAGPSFAIAIFSMPINSHADPRRAVPLRRVSKQVHANPLPNRSSPNLAFALLFLAKLFCTIQNSTIPGYTALCDSFALLFFFGRMRVSLSRYSSSGSCSFSLPS